MPATATHAIFADDIYQKLNKKYRKILEPEKKSLLMFAQSTDPMMFYPLFRIKTQQKLLNFSHTFHTTKTNQYFTNLIHHIKKEKDYHDPQTLAYLYGLICHFCLDSTCHPYIFYKTGIFNKQDKTTWSYNGLHNEMETFLDNIMLERRNVNRKKFTFKNYCFDLKPFSKSLKDCIHQSFLQTYEIDHMDRIYQKALKKMAYLLDLLRIDHYGVKQLGYKILDHMKPKNTMILKYISYYPFTPKRDYLNEQHKTWCYPTDKNIQKTESFFDLYEQAQKQAIQIINQVNDYLFENKPIHIEKLFQNKSYVTGLDCTQTKPLQYFEF